MLSRFTDLYAEYVTHTNIFLGMLSDKLPRPLVTGAPAHMGWGYGDWSTPSFNRYADQWSGGGGAD